LGSMRDWIFVPLNLLFSRKSVLWPRNGPARARPSGRAMDSTTLECFDLRRSCG
jgi:hypothetical protein